MEKKTAMAGALFHLTISFVASLNNIDDESSLLAIKTQIHSEILSKNWTQQTSFCTWIGVSCSQRRRRVAALDLSGMGLRGSIGREIGNLSFLTFLNINNNILRGPIPEEIGKLRRLRVLDMSSNRLSDGIPKTLGLLTRLKRLQLSLNHLTGNIPSDLGNLSRLQAFVLRGNQLTGTLIPEEIGKLRRLRVLDVAMNKLSGGIPQTLGFLGKLIHLDLSFNFLTGNIPHTLSASLQLTTLELLYNNLTGNIPSTLGNLSQLQELLVMGNQLIGELPPTIFNISSLETLVVARNLMSGRIPEEICSQLGSKLEFLSLDYNEFEGEILSSLMHCHSLTTLSLVGNNFTGQIPNQFWNLSDIQYLEWGKNSFTGSLPPTVGNLSNLELIDITQNSFHGTIPSEIGTLSSLKYLSFQLNYLNGEVPQSIFNLSSLEVLSLAYNNLWGTLPFSIHQGLPDIQRIYLDANQFHGNIPNSISNLSHLTILSLFNNSFTGHVPITLGNLHQLIYLNLGSNHLINNISNPDQDFLSSLTTCNYLNTMDISGNPAMTGALPKSFGTTSLEEFYANSCNITGQLPNEIGNMTKLIWLDLANNGLSGAVPTTLGYLSNLQKLELQSNQLQGTISHVVCNLKNLYSINLAQNDFSGHMPSCLGSLYSLREINFADNAFNSNIPSTLWSAENVQSLILSSNFFDGSLPQEIGNLKSLTELDLSGNQLSGQIPITISQLQNLISLSLSDNNFDGLIPDLFAAMNNLQHLDLSQNNLSGPFPESLEALLYLNYFNVSFNNLSGEIPDTEPYVNFTSESFAGNKGLCGAPRFRVKACRSSTLRPSSKNKIMMHIIAPVIVAAFILVTVIRYYGRKSPTPSLPTLPLVPTRKRISHREILDATRNFHEENLIGRGGISSVYKGIFSDAMVAAVKVFNLEIQGALKSFDVECQVLSSVRHRNLVEVITSCSNLDFKAVLMAYMPKGNLDRWLYSADCSLNLLQRVGIMIDVASALEYLHQWHTFPIVHCDIKPSNILLDEDMVAHVADFGIAKLLTEEHRMQLTTTLGTIGYMAPEYGSEGIVSSMVDVYSYVVLLMEILVRRKPTDAMFSGEFNMKRWVLESFPDSVMEIVDDDLINMDADQSVRSRHERCLISCVEVALECTAELAEERPEMEDVAVRMRKIKLSLLASN